MIQHYITKEGLQKLKKELEELQTVKMPEVIERITRARELGDLAENAEYSDAKDTQSFLAGRVVELEHLIHRSVVITEQSGSETIEVGSTITVRCGEQQFTYTIVGSNEADPANGKISNESPIARAFLGKAKGDDAVIQAPRGAMTCTVMNIK